MNTVLKRTALSSLIVPFALAAASASAAPIASWDYKVDSNFSNETYTGTVGFQTDTTGVPNANKLEWGSNTNTAERSSVSITDVDSTTDGSLPKLVTNDVTAPIGVDGGVFTHNNTSINLNFDTLVSFDLTSTLTLLPIPAAAGSIETLDPITFSTRFTETNNDAGNGSCAFGDEPCGDIFTIVSVEGLAFNGAALSPQTFIQGGYLYSVFLEIDGLTSDIPEAACLAATGSSGPCVGLLTPENDKTGFQTSFRIEAREVPEPGTLALLGMGLAGLGLARRRKSAKA